MGSDQSIRLVDGEIDLQLRLVRRGGRDISLTPKEAALVAYLADVAPEVVGHDELLSQVWGYHESTRTNTVHVTLMRLRKKLELDSRAPVHLVTVPGEGWRLDPATESQGGPLTDQVAVAARVLLADDQAQLATFEQTLADWMHGHEGAFLGDTAWWLADHDHLILLPQLMQQLRAHGMSTVLAASREPLTWVSTQATRTPTGRARTTLLMMLAMAPPDSIVLTEGLDLPNPEGWTPWSRDALGRTDQVRVNITQPLDAARAQQRVQLPTALDRFFGRERLVAEVRRALVGERRLITLHGPGGCGKTRLALHVAHQLQAEARVPRGGLWFVDCTEATDDTQLRQRLAHQLDLDPDDLAGGLVSKGPTLIIIDNLEQAASPAAALLDELLRSAPQARLLATSRVVLGCAGEQLVSVGSLPEDDGIALLEDRLESVGASRPEKATALALVRALDGLPLAVELLAARARTLDAPTMLQQLRQRGFGLLKSKRGGRQGTMASTLAWSWELLAAAQQHGLMVLSHLRTSCPFAETANAVGLEVLEDLLDHSLVRPAPTTSGPPRYHLLATVHWYANERRRATDIEQQRRAGRDFARGMASATPGLIADLPNTAAALDIAIEQRLGHEAATLLRRVAGALQFKPEARVWCERVLALPLKGDDELDARMMYLNFLVNCGSTEVFDAEAQRCLDLALNLARTQKRGQLLLTVAAQRVHNDGNLDESLSYLGEALICAETIDDPRAAATLKSSILAYIARVHIIRGQLADAIEHLREALPLADASGFALERCRVRVNLARALQDDPTQREEAKQHFGELLHIGQELGHHGDDRNVHIALARLFACEGRTEEAARHLEEAQRVSEEHCNGAGTEAIEQMWAQIEDGKVDPPVFWRWP